MADPFIGQVTLMAFNFNPRGWYTCNGSLLPISSNSTLFSLLGTFYGGDGRTTFALPDLRGRTPMSKGRHPGSGYDWRIGMAPGGETHTMTIPELAAHTHGASFTATSTTLDVTFEATTDDGDSATPADGCFLATAVPPTGGPDKPEQIYKQNPSSGSEVTMGGVTVTGDVGGVVSVNNNGGSVKFNIMQPSLALNHCLAHVGTYPPRS
ncbi:phage tail protein [Vibrio owensii]|uniref:phage tail protein n=1 Tax=Vibrio owensii TaxID=696485 RepID=UPI0040693F7C